MKWFHAGTPHRVECSGLPPLLAQGLAPADARPTALDASMRLSVGRCPTLMIAGRCPADARPTALNASTRLSVGRCPTLLIAGRCPADARPTALNASMRLSVGRCPTLLIAALSGLRKRRTSPRAESPIINSVGQRPASGRVGEAYPSLPRRGYITSVGQRPTLAATNTCRLKAYHHDARPTALNAFTRLSVGRCPTLLIAGRCPADARPTALNAFTRLSVGRCPTLLIAALSGLIRFVGQRPAFANPKEGGVWL